MPATKTVHFGVITNEIDDDFERACGVARSLGMEYVEVHTLWNKDVDELSDPELDEVERILSEHGLKTYLVCGLFFRPFSLADVTLAGMEAHPRFQEHMQKLERFIHIAHRLHAPYIRAFGFTRDVGGTNPSAAGARWRRVG